MQRSYNRLAPIITILSPHRDASLRMIESIQVQSIGTSSTSTVNCGGKDRTKVQVQVQLPIDNDATVVNKDSVTVTSTSKRIDSNDFRIGTRITNNNNSNNNNNMVEESRYRILSTGRISTTIDNEPDELDKELNICSSSSSTSSVSGLISSIGITTYFRRYLYTDSFMSRLRSRGSINNKNKHLWESVAVQINNNGPVLHFLSPSDSVRGTSTSSSSSTSSTLFMPSPASQISSYSGTILSIQGDFHSIQDTRNRLANQLHQIANDIKSNRPVTYNNSSSNVMGSFLSRAETIGTQLRNTVHEYIGRTTSSHQSSLALRRLVQNTEKFIPLLDFDIPTTTTTTTTTNQHCNDHETNQSQFVQSQQYTTGNLNQQRTNNWRYGDLKEIVIPTYLNDDDDNSSDNVNGKTTDNLLSRLSALAFMSMSMSMSVPSQSIPNNKDDDQLYQSSTLIHRVLPGLYQINDASKLCIRPIPVAEHDQLLSAPTLVFYTPDLETLYTPTTSSQQHVENNNDVSTHHQQQQQQQQQQKTRYSKIGYNGKGIGQVLIHTEPYFGCDIRYCSSTTLTSMFCEAQGALLAGSLSSLQSDHVVNVRGTAPSTPSRSGITILSKNPTSTATTASSSSTTSTSTLANDTTSTTNADERHCWTEFHESLQFPQRYLDATNQQRRRRQQQRQRIAPSQNLPFE